MVCIQYHSSLASLNGLEAHLRTISPGAPGAPGPYIFAHFDCIQSTLTSEAPKILTHISLLFIHSFTLVIYLISICIFFFFFASLIFLIILSFSVSQFSLFF